MYNYTMTRKTKIIIGISIIILFLAFLATFIDFPQNSKRNIHIPPTPIRTPNKQPSPTESISDLLPPDFPRADPSFNPPPPNTAQNLYITSANPSDGATGVPVDKKIVLSFNRELTADEISFSLGSSVEFDMKASGNQIIITPKKPLESHAIYVYAFTYSGGGASKSYTFITEGTGPIKNMREETDIHNAQDRWDIVHNPDVFLERRTPYSESLFSVTSAFSDQTTYYYFTVALVGDDKEKAKQAFINWIKSTGMKDQQISTLDIRYNQ